MKHFKKWFLGVLFSFIVLIGSLIIANLSFQKQSHGIPNVNAQTKEQINLPGDTFLIPRGSANSSGYGALFASHPSDTFYIPSEPGFPANPDNDYYMPGVRTMSTASTCAWDCGQTYTTCALTCGRSAQGGTSMTCGSGFLGNCPGQTSTSTTCNSGIFCDGGISPTFTTCSSGIFCGGGPTPTSSTCSGGIFCDGGISPTFTTCSSGIFCGGGPTPTSSTCSSGIFCGGGISPTFTTCSSGIFCGGGPTPTSSTCSSGIFCGGGINTLRTCIGNCPTELPISLPEGVTTRWGQGGILVPGSIVPFPVYSATPSF